MDTSQLPTMTDTLRQARLESVIISPSCSISEAMVSLDKAGTGALVLCTGSRMVVGLLTDGDIRRAILKGRSLGDLCSSIANKKPILAVRPVSSAEALGVMNQRDIHHLPVVDKEGILADFILRQDLQSDFE